ncbi:hypothetical protein [Dyella silvatica]|uniref:hypothetical protein n=1 Tax=Dyella silvatica TaxID=2992128 RepID=UPI00225695A5|nr:hypothetical protein [Dyella silvatica]
MSLRFESRLHVPAEQVWAWITSVPGISAEMWPFFRMTTPKGLLSLSDRQLTLGVPMFRSYLLLLGVLPVDYSELTLLELHEGRGFVEQSAMASMKLWRHERSIEACRFDPAAVLLIDRLTFQPRMAKRWVGWFVRQFFNHRHKVLRARLNGTTSCAS